MAELGSLGKLRKSGQIKIKSDTVIVITSSDYVNGTSLINLTVPLPQDREHLSSISHMEASLSITQLSGDSPEQVDLGFRYPKSSF